MRNEILKAINSNPSQAAEALETTYRGKVFAVAMSNGHVMSFYKTKRGAEGYVKKQSSVSFYDEYSQSMTTCGNGLNVIEISETEIVNPAEDVNMWYEFIKSYLNMPSFMSNIVATAKRMNVSEDVMSYVEAATNEVFTTGGLTVLESTEEAEEAIIEEAQVIEEKIEQVNTMTVEASGEVAYKLNDEKQGVEIYFSSKPSQEVLETLKANKFRWSRYNKCWYAKQSDSTIELAKKLAGENKAVEAVSEPVSYPEVEIDDNDTYVVDQQLQDREHEANWVLRRNKKDHNAILSEHFEHYTNKVKEVVSTTDNEHIIYKLKSKLQTFKKKYHEAYVKQLVIKSNNPSWVTTGRAGRSASKHNKAMDRYDKLMHELIELGEYIDKAINSAKYQIEKLEKEAIKNAVSNVSIDEYKFETITKKTDTRNVRMYKLNEYHIVKDWSAYAIFYKGKEVHRMKTTDKLNDAKQYVIYLMQNEKESVTA
ncbi:hypothetical protein [Priestia megaterium]|uniref:hypothetical protein n=1 Tax=Priestia megaterium TaxID=1404 RepID=UPI00112B9139|nr:hypothetical protein [Priestia megaterium]TPF17980.1 hypothetical protein CBE78_01780 [Priestia megaterium]TPF22088.1 hypothetical protein CBE79_04285 [Priestia megaterium]